jgi:hypothetical protein
VTSIASASSYQIQSPRDFLQNQLLSAIASGAVNASDKTALSTALDDIDTALKDDGSRKAGPPSPDQMKSKLDELISSEVKAGKLTDDQAGELRDIFTKVLSADGQSGPSGAQGPGESPSHAGGPAKGCSGAGNSVSEESANDSGSSASDVLQNFLKLIQEAQSTTGYSASGDTQKAVSALLLNYQA